MNAIKREQKHIDESIKTDNKLKKKIGKVFRQHLDQIEKEVKSVIFDYEEISLEEHYQRIEKERIDDLRKEVEEARKTDNKEAIVRLGMLYLGYKMTRDKYIENKVDLGTIRAFIDQDKLIYKEMLKQSKNELLRQIEIFNLTESQSQKLGNILDKAINKSQFSDYVWRDQKALRNRLVNGINQSIARNQNPKAWSNDLKDLVNKEFKNIKYATERIAITEVSKAQIEVQEELFKHNNVKKWIWIAEPTACPDCAGLDGEVFKVGTDDPLPGFIHPFCRCSRAEYME